MTSNHTKRKRQLSVLAAMTAACFLAVSEAPAQMGTTAVDQQEQGLFQTPFTPIFNHNGPGADFIVGSETTRTAGISGAAGQLCPFLLTDKALPPLPAGAVPVHTFISWNYLANDMPPIDTIVINGAPITGTLCGSGSNDLCWGKDFGVSYIYDTPGLGPVIPGGANLIGGACDKPLGADSNALGEGISILVIFDVPASPPRNVDVYCGYVSTQSGGATDTLPYTVPYNGGTLHFFISTLDGQDSPEDFFINGFNVSGLYPQTVVVGDAWTGLLWGGPSVFNNLYDHGNGDISIWAAVGDLSVMFSTLSGGDCIGHSFAAASFGKEAEAGLDIKPGSCPNSFNRNSNGFLPVALVGTSTFDVSQVDLDSLALVRKDGVGGSVAPHEGPPGPHTVIGDTATPFPGELCDCHEETGDGVDDLNMKFKTQEVVDALDLDDLSPGELVDLTLIGELLDGTEFAFNDCIRLVPPGTHTSLPTPRLR